MKEKGTLNAAVILRGLAFFVVLTLLPLAIGPQWILNLLVFTFDVADELRRGEAVGRVRDERRQLATGTGFMTTGSCRRAAPPGARHQSTRHGSGLRARRRGPQRGTRVGRASAEQAPPLREFLAGYAVRNENFVLVSRRITG